MHNNDFDILLRSFHYSAKLQIAKIHKNVQKIKMKSVEGVASFWLNIVYMNIRTPNSPCTDNTLFFWHFYGVLRFVVWPNKKFDMILREKGRDLTHSYDNSPYTYKKFQRAKCQHKYAIKNLYYTTIADRHRTVSWSNDIIQHVWLNQFTGSQPPH